MRRSETNLTNCAEEPIHIPGSVQPHGILLGSSEVRGGIELASENATALSGPEVFGLTFPELFGPTAIDRLERALALGEQARVNPIAVQRHRTEYDAIVHTSDRFVLVELEPTQPEDDLRYYIADANLATARVQASTSLDALFDAAVQEVARMTGFDRVMLYRFHPDDSGEVVSELRAREDLPPYLGLRYPESDIPKQARRLYCSNWLRLIVDVAATPCPIRFADHVTDAGPLDLSHACLRSVSPIHTEYLQNMGVAASMSISLVVDDRLYGLIACHHGQPHRVPYSVRMACEHLGRSASLQIATLCDRIRSRRRSEGSTVAARLVQRCEPGRSLEDALLGGTPTLLDLVPSADSVTFVNHGRISSSTQAPPASFVTTLLPWLEERGEGVSAFHTLPELFEPAAAHAQTSAGLLAVAVDEAASVWVLWHRGEQTGEVRWGHEPTKQTAVGPSGSRLTPPGSFETWVQSVRGRSAPWAAGDIDAAESLRGALVSLVLARVREEARARKLAMRIVGHDLRSPLSALLQGVELLSSDPPEAIAGRVLEQLRRAGSRLHEMLSHFFDFQRIEAGLGLELRRRRTDVSELVGRACDEARMAAPSRHFVTEIRADIDAEVDADRLQQVLSNLLSNACHHGASDQPITVSLALGSGREVRLSVHNWGSPIPLPRQRTLFDAYEAIQTGTRPHGLGLGLHIVRWIVEAHGGRIDVASSEREGTRFQVTLPGTDAGAR